MGKKYHAFLSLRTNQALFSRGVLALKPTTVYGLIICIVNGNFYAPCRNIKKRAGSPLYLPVLFSVRTKTLNHGFVGFALGNVRDRFETCLY